ncbi:tetratricopeptide repeat protein [Marinihelvus fidelis]|uniref:Tetratricopeptide repeat protein n=1 Tax=Marinihelvus fidelis TaxID=2613842 RepID=A0A5N0T3N9_9GAMM|nr:tetratricopeptide repeat protein [Marinihelvus fidelis]KAA9129563.1 tetratricopeptide repeat protein [Marinihelvus fidelis]
MSIAPPGQPPNPAEQFARRFQNALAAFNRGDLATALQACQALDADLPNHADVQHLMAMAWQRLGQVINAEKAFRRSLAANPRQPAVLSNLATLLRRSRRFEEADQALASAIELQPGLANAWYNRGLVSLDRHRPTEAIEQLQRAVQLDPRPGIEMALVRALQAAGREDDARDLADNIAARHPNDARAVMTRARQHRKKAPADALAMLQTLLQTTQDRARVQHEIGLLKTETKALDEAIVHFQAALEAQPLLIDAHRALNEIFWQQDDDRFGQSYRDAIARAPAAAPLYHNYASALRSAGREDEAEAILESAISRAGPDPFLLHGLAVQKLRRGDDDTPRQLLDRALSAQPDNVRFRIDCANLDIRGGDYASAERHLDHARAVEPWNQEVWAYLGVAWRLAGDPKHEWLNDYDTLLKTFTLPSPTGFTGTQAFMEELAGFLPTLHSAGRQPLDQSVRNGTQTFEILFGNSHPLITALKQSVDTVLAEYLAALPDDDRHPFYARKRQATYYTGSWSIMLRSGGHHTNHVHPQGWLSCCNYIALPPLGDDTTRDGWIRFGETSLGLGDREHVARTIRPAPGQCVFFPSYFWHGTYRFDSETPRMTVPCDIDPA